MSPTQGSSLADVQGFCFHTPPIQDRSTGGGGGHKKKSRGGHNCTIKA